MERQEVLLAQRPMGELEVRSEAGLKTAMAEALPRREEHLRRVQDVECMWMKHVCVGVAQTRQNSHTNDHTSDTHPAASHPVRNVQYRRDKQPTPPQRLVAQSPRAAELNQPRTSNQRHQLRQSLGHRVAPWHGCQEIDPLPARPVATRDAAAIARSGNRGKKGRR